MDPVDLTLLMPCLNEAETLEACIRKAQAGLQAVGLAGEVLIADNGSTDGSQDIATRCGARVVSIPRPGYGSALQGGIAEARGRWIIMGDADDSYDFSAIEPLVRRLQEGCDLVMGCRLPQGNGQILPGAMPWHHRVIGNPVLSGLGRLFFHSTVTDFHCGLRGFSRAAIVGLDLRTTGMEFASEMVIRATLAGLKIGEVPIVLHPDGRSRPPHLRSFRDGWRHLRFMLLYSPRWLFLVPGVVLFALGILGFSLLLPGALRIGPVVLDVNTLLVASLLCLVGFQLVSFGISARVFAVSEGLLPPEPRLVRFLQHASLEAGLVVGGAIFTAGLALMGVALWYWSTLRFGNIPYPVGLRIVIPAVTLLALGVQVIFTSFFLSLLALGRR